MLTRVYTATIRMPVMNVDAGVFGYDSKSPLMDLSALTLDVPAWGRKPAWPRMKGMNSSSAKRRTNDEPQSLLLTTRKPSRSTGWPHLLL